MIVITDYDGTWPRLFRDLASPVARAVSDLGAEVEHVGSTAVPGLAAKPIIDMDVVVPSAEVIPRAIERLRRLGYIHQGDLGISGREAFQSPPGAPPHHLYVTVAGSKQHRDHLLFRDQLRGDPDLASRYASLKRRLAAEYIEDRGGYSEAKSAFISSALAAADRDLKKRARGVRDG
ncbi:MAG: GrpB family protein [Candidatus Dormibacteria bacterium]